MLTIPGTLIVAPDVHEVAREAAQRMATVLQAALDARGRASVALSGGTSPERAYAELARRPVDWSRVHVYFVDERAVDPSSERSNYRMVHRTLLEPAGVPAAHVHRMRGEADDLDAAAREYEAALAEAGTLDLITLGVGDDGHTASLFPGDHAVDERALAVVAVAGTPSREARLTLTRLPLEAASEALVIALGEKKREPLRRAWSETGSLAETPARIMRHMRRVTWITDPNAISLV